MLRSPHPGPPRVFRVLVSLSATVLVYVTSTPCAAITSSSETELITNGDFSLGNSEFVTDYEYKGCTSVGHYDVLSDARSCHSSWIGTDHTSPGTGSFMAVNAATVAGMTVWQQAVTVEPNQHYRLTGWVSTLYPVSPATLALSINDSTVGLVAAPSSTNAWIQFSVIWFSGAMTAATLRIVGTNLAGNGNDFGLDDLSFREYHLGVAESLVCEDFPGSTFGSRWLATPNSGSIVIDDQGVTLSGSGGQFPFVRSAWPLLRAGDFALAFKLKYNSVTARGTGIGWGVGVPTGPTSDCVGTSVPSFRVWQDETSAGLRASSALIDPCTQTNINLEPPADLLWHRYRFERLGSNYGLYVDGAHRASWIEPFGNNFSLDLWFGSPLDAGSPAEWTSFTLDSVQIAAYEPVPTEVTLPDFSDVSGLSLIGSAAQSGSALRLVPASGSRVGAAFWSEPLPVAAFASDFRFRITNGGGLDGGADGLTFCIRGAGSQVPGPAGGNLGYTGVTPSLAVEFDVYGNGEFNDPNNNHLGINLAGSVSSIATVVDPLGPDVSLKDGSIYHVWIDFDGSTLEVALAPDGMAKPGPVLSRATCLPFTLGAVGFTAATASGYANHDILSWNYTAIPSQNLFSGDIAAFTIDKPSETAPTVRALQAASIGFEYLGELFPSDAISGSDGSFSIAHPALPSDHLLSRLKNGMLTIVDTPSAQGACDPTPALGHSASGCSTATLRWQSSDLEATSAFYLAESFLREFWGQALSRPPAGTCTLFVRNEDLGVLWAGGASASRQLSSSGDGRINVYPEYALYGPVVRHEVSHWLINQAAGNLALSENRNDLPEAGGLDEGLADFFAASAAADPIIASPKNPLRWRNLEQAVPYKYYSCPEEETHDGYFYARVVGGSLWDMRAAILNEDPLLSPRAVERWLYDEIGTFAAAYSVDQRTLDNFRKHLKSSSFGSLKASSIDEAFARHNVKENPQDLCGMIPTVSGINRVISEGAAAFSFAWSVVEAAIHYRVYTWNLPSGSANGFDIGELIADSVTTTSFVYETNDTTANLSFLVSAVDAMGIEWPASREAPAVTSIGRGADWPARLRFVVFPNPMEGSSRIAFQTGPGASFRASIYSVKGGLMRSYAGQAAGDGDVVLTWDGRTESGERLPAGVYFIRIAALGLDATGRVILLR